MFLSSYNSQQDAIKDKRRKINNLLVQQKKAKFVQAPQFTDEMLQAAKEYVIEPKSEEIKGTHLRITDRPTKKVKEYRFGNIKIMPLTRKTLRPISLAIKEFQASALSRTKRRSSLGKKNYGPAPFFKK
jgi:hypothetical protein